jgi:signal transduction histidine kinase
VLPTPTEHSDRTYDQLATIGEVAAEIAHELQSALHAISARALLAKHDASRGATETTLDHVNRIAESAHSARSIVDDLMCLATQRSIRSESVPLSYVFLEARRDLSERCARWDDELEPAELAVRGHGTLVVRMFHALYENAILASTPRLPVIATSARLLPGGIVVDVTDDGPGVPLHLGNRIFDPLVSARPGGTGLGLALALRIAHAHGGTIALGFAGGPGATFRVALPAA